MDNLLSFLGLIHKAGKLAIGEEPVGASCRAKDCRVLLVAQDATAPTYRRAKHFAEAGQCLLLKLPFDKDAVGSAVGRSTCALLAIEDIGFADALVRRLAQNDPSYAEAAERLQIKAQRAMERKKEQLRHEKNLRNGQKSAKATVSKKAKEAEPAKTAPVPTETKKPFDKKPFEGKKPYRKPSDKPFASRNVSRETNKKRVGSGKQNKPQGNNRFAESRPVKKGKGSPKAGKSH